MPHYSSQVCLIITIILGIPGCFGAPTGPDFAKPPITDNVKEVESTDSPVSNEAPVFILEETETDDSLTADEGQELENNYLAGLNESLSIVEGNEPLPIVAEPIPENGSDTLDAESTAATVPNEAPLVFLVETENNEDLTADEVQELVDNYLAGLKESLSKVVGNEPLPVLANPVSENGYDTPDVDDLLLLDEFSIPVNDSKVADTTETAPEMPPLSYWFPTIFQQFGKLYDAVTEERTSTMTPIIQRSATVNPENPSPLPPTTNEPSFSSSPSPVNVPVPETPSTTSYFLPHPNAQLTENGNMGQCDQNRMSQLLPLNYVFVLHNPTFVIHLGSGEGVLPLGLTIPVHSDIQSHN